MSHGHSLQLDFQMRASSADSIRASRFFGLHNRPYIRLLLPTRQHGYLLSSGRRPYKTVPRENFSSRVGYIYTALSHPTLGRPLVKSLAYGSSIPEIEVEDVNNLQVVRLTEEQEAAIADLAESAAKLYADADILENEMTTLMEQHLQKILGK